MKYSEEQLAKYSKYLSLSEDETCERTIRKIKRIFENSGFKPEQDKFNDADEHLDYSYAFKDDEGNDFLFLVQGSYQNGTCIKKNSDIDVAIVCESTFRGKYNIFKSEDYGFCPSSFNIFSFKSKLFKIFTDNGFSIDIGHKKCLKVREASSTREFDIVPCLRYRDYTKDFNKDKNNYEKGILIKDDDGNETINYPEQSCVNNIFKNKYTNTRYKKAVRIFKNIKRDMEKEGIEYAKNISSFEIENLIYNVPNLIFSIANNIDVSYTYLCDRIIKYLIQNAESLSKFYETNGKLLLYREGIRNVDIVKKFINVLDCYFNE